MLQTKGTPCIHYMFNKRKVARETVILVRAQTSSLSALFRVFLICPYSKDEGWVCDKVLVNFVPSKSCDRLSMLFAVPYIGLVSLNSKAGY